MKGNFVVLNPTSGADFSVSSNPSSLTIPQSSSGTTSITLSSLNGFSGTVSLTVTVSPSGPQPTINPASVSLSAGGSVSSTLTISTSLGYYSTPVAQGNYAVNMTATSGSLHHSTPVSLTVGTTTSSPPASAPSLPLLPIAGGIIAVVAVIGIALFLRTRKRQPAALFFRGPVVPDNRMKGDQG
jgi:hypothetical protein